MTNCQKVPYETKANANADARVMRLSVRRFSKHAGRAPKSGRKLRAYKCERCGKWHLTSWSKQRVK